MCDVSKPIVCIIRIFFSHPPPPLACLSAGRLDFGDGWFVKKHRQVTLLFSYVLADSRTFLIPPCATHENPFPLEGLPMQLTGPFFLLFFPFPSSFIFYSMVAGWIYNNGFSPTNRKKKILSIHRRCCAYRVSNPSFAFSFFFITTPQFRTRSVTSREISIRIIWFYGFFSIGIFFFFSIFFVFIHMIKFRFIC